MKTKYELGNYVFTDSRLKEELESYLELFLNGTINKKKYLALVKGSIQIYDLSVGH